MKKAIKPFLLSLVAICMLASCNKVKQLTNKGQWDLAEEYCASLDSSKQYSAFTDLGDAYFNSDSIQKAKQCYLKVKNKEAIAKIGDLYLSQQEIDSAYSYYKIYDYKPGFKTLADTLLNKGNYKGAIFVYKKTDLNTEVCTSIASAYVGIKNNDSALVYLSKAGIENEAAFEFIANKYTNKMLYDKAIECFKKTAIPENEYYTKIADNALKFAQISTVDYYLKAGLTQQQVDEKIETSISNGNYSIGSKLAIKNNEKEKAAKYFKKLIKSNDQVSVYQIDATFTGIMAADGMGVIRYYMNKIDRNKDYKTVNDYLKDTLPNNFTFGITYSMPKDNINSAVFQQPQFWVNEKEINGIISESKHNIYIVSNEQWNEQKKHDYNDPLKFEITHFVIIYIPALEIAKTFRTENKFELVKNKTEYVDQVDKACNITMNNELVLKNELYDSVLNYINEFRQ